jgi:hypothetical protein
MSVSPSYAQKITYSNGTQTQSVTPTKADKVKCGKYHSPLINIPNFKLIKQKCAALRSGDSSLEFRSKKIYVNRANMNPGLDIYFAPSKQIKALKKSLKTSLAKGWTLLDIENVATRGDSWTANLRLENAKVPILLTAVLEVKPEIVLAAGETGYGEPYGKSWVTISVRNIYQYFIETECAPNC